MQRLQLFERVHVTLDTDGAGRAQLGPLGTHERWDVSEVIVRVSPAVLVPSARLYAGNVVDAHYRAGSYTGHQDTATFDPPVPLLSAEYLTIVWADGDPGAAASMELRGWKYLG